MATAVAVFLEIFAAAPAHSRGAAASRGCSRPVQTSNWNAASILQTAEHEVQQKRREQETGTWRGRTVQNRRNGLREEPLGVGEPAPAEVSW